MGILTKVLLILLLSVPVWGVKRKVPLKFNPETSILNVKFKSNYDGDTITVDIPRTREIFGKEIPIRINGIDAPEIRSKGCQKVRSKKAKDFVTRELENAHKIHLINIDRGKYFRIVADVIYYKKSRAYNLAHELLKKNLAVRYHGDTKPTVDWCPPKPYVF